ncbi:Family S53 protease-like protein [Mycena indigotica]|uniref:Family S53 protease-like protein n=1 Tax=Mycena indigotica TaxID=2126181 RepID=A0A8H6RZ56_9AGAR|nr:Family S53 protease-like protein [Mycena indigotica]KAF7288912.1 Family S53 protease-like protein [Mycena indigotica]
MALRVLTFCSLLLPLATAFHQVLLEQRSAVPQGFRSLGPAPSAVDVTLRFGLAPNNIEGLQAKLLSISTPNDENFRKWLSADEVKSYAQPSSQSLAAFESFLSTHGLTTSNISPNGDWASITLPIAQANSLFAANFHSFTHPDLPAPIIRTLSVSLPAELVGHVEVIHPTTQFAVPKPKQRLPSFVPVNKQSQSRVIKRGAQAVDPSCDASIPTGVITPKCLQDLYGIPIAPATQQGNSILVPGYEDQWAQDADVAQFLALVRPDIPSNTTFTLQTTAGGTNPQGPDFARGEADMDVEYTIGIATGIPTIFLSVGGIFNDTALVDTITFLEGVPDNKLPTVMSTSYAQSETDFGRSLATRICNGYMALGARGMSVIFGSGDAGVRGNHVGRAACANNTFEATFPASCPFVTTVGGTIGLPPNEKAINFTGGGFSNYFSAPSYQTAQVAAFLDTVPADFGGTFNRSGRGYPDVALQAWNYQVVVAGEPDTSGGTSASTPAFAGMIALLNDQLLAKGKPVLGFLNPWLYANQKTFGDVTTGHNSGFFCDPETTPAFDAIAGWDALTGLGTPQYNSLLSAALAQS